MPASKVSLEEMLGAGLRIRPEQASLLEYDGSDGGMWALVVDQIEDPAHMYGCSDYSCRSGIYINERALVVPKAVEVDCEGTYGETTGFPWMDERFPSIWGSYDDRRWEETFTSRHRVWDACPITVEESVLYSNALEKVMEGELVGRLQEVAGLLVGEDEVDPEVLGMEWRPGAYQDDAWCTEYAKRIEEYAQKAIEEAEAYSQTVEQAGLDKLMALPPQQQKKWRDLQMISRKGWLWVAETYPEHMTLERAVYDPWY